MTNASYPTEYMQSLANSRRKQWDKLSDEGKKALADASLKLEHFGDLPAFKEFGRMYVAAQEIYVNALDAAGKDIDAIAQGIIDSAKSMEGRDTEAGAAFLALKAKWDNGGMGTEQVHSSENGQHQQRRTAETVDPVGEGKGQDVPKDASASGGDTQSPSTSDEAPKPSSKQLPSSTIV